MSIFFAALSALSYGAADYAGGKATRAHNVLAVLVLSQIVGLAGILVVAVVLRQPMAPGVDAWGVAAGLSGVVGLSSLYRGLATGAAAIVSPTAALFGSAAPILAGLLLAEVPTLTGWIGVGLALPAILLLSRCRSAFRPTVAPLWNRRRHWIRGVLHPHRPYCGRFGFLAARERSDRVNHRCRCRGARDGEQPSGLAAGAATDPARRHTRHGRQYLLPHRHANRPARHERRRLIALPGANGPVRAGVRRTASRPAPHRRADPLARRGRAHGDLRRLRGV